MPDNARAAFLRTPLGPVDTLKRFSFLKYIKRKGPKDDLHEATYYLEVSMDQLATIRRLAKDMADDSVVEETLERVEGRCEDLEIRSKYLQVARDRRSTFTKIFSSSLDRDIRDFLLATHTLSVEAKRASDTVTTRHSRRTFNTRNLEIATPAEFDTVAGPNIPPTARIEGVSITQLPSNGQIGDNYRRIIQEVADIIMGRNGGTSDIESEAATPLRRSNSLNSIRTSSTYFTPPPSPSPSLPDLPDPDIPHGRDIPPSRPRVAIVSPADIIRGAGNFSASPITHLGSGDIHNHYYGNVTFNVIQDSQLLGESVNPTFNTRSSGTQGATFSNPTSPA
ncbi:hypothetical protein BJ138DRAFT_1161935 [Hygrophoropsis aurantiaca]|uniref:Uncharacterized protein n=1 Tax=Hygrophoropsis aurantiaca TaxID=72124 RepID=A0ACB8A139_9AGAM|nr:hypothetical protein BJ138DRAFT_1161935 [Hygrophoropsis aurantiaca]